MNMGPELRTAKLCREALLVALVYIDRVDSDRGAMLENRLQGIEGGNGCSGDSRSSLGLVLLYGSLQVLENERIRKS